MWMRVVIAFLLAIGAVLMIVAAIPSETPPAPGMHLRNGDIVLQSSSSEQARWIEQATRSPYSHMGLIELRDGVPWVLEAETKVDRVPWAFWWPRGRGHRVAILRLPGLTAEQALDVVQAGESFLGRPYDPKFEWSDDRLYCSELVEKAYERGADISLGRLQRLDTLRLDGLGPTLARRFGDNVPLDELLITPASIAADPRLTVVWTSFARPLASSP